MDIDSDQEIWNFVSKHNIDGLIDCESLSIIEEDLNINRKKLLKTINLLGQEVKYRNSENGEILFKIYDDGSVEKCLK